MGIRSKARGKKWKRRYETEKGGLGLVKVYVHVISALSWPVKGSDHSQKYRSFVTVSAVS